MARRESMVAGINSQKTCLAPVRALQTLSATSMAPPPPIASLVGMRISRWAGASTPLRRVCRAHVDR